MENIEKTNTKNKFLSIMRQIFCFATIACGAIGGTVILFSYMFGIFTDGYDGINVIEMFELMISIFVSPSWESILSIFVGAIFIPSTVFIIKSFVKVVKKTVAYIKAYCAKDVNLYVEFCKSMREITYEIFLNCFVILSIGKFVLGLEASAGAITGLSFLFAGYILSNIGLIFWQKKLPCVRFIISECIRSVAVPFILLAINNLIIKSELVASFGYSFVSFAESVSDASSFFTVSRSLFLSVAEPIGWFIGSILFLTLCGTTASKLSNLERSYSVDDTPLAPKFLSLAIYVSVWSMLKCLVTTFVEENALENFEILELIPDWFALTRNDYLPIILLCVATYILLYVKFDKYEGAASLAHEDYDEVEGEATEDATVAVAPVAEEAVATEETVASEPTVEEVTPAEPVADEKIAVEPVAESVVAEPVVAEPVVAEPVKVEPVVAKPVKAEPVKAEQPKKAFCRFCGGKIEPGSKFCCNCGQKLD